MQTALVGLFIFLLDYRLAHTSFFLQFVYPAHISTHCRILLLNIRPRKGQGILYLDKLRTSYFLSCWRYSKYAAIDGASNDGTRKEVERVASVGQHDCFVVPKEKALYAMDVK